MVVASRRNRSRPGILRQNFTCTTRISFTSIGDPGAIRPPLPIRTASRPRPTARPGSHPVDGPHPDLLLHLCHGDKFAWFTMRRNFTTHSSPIRCPPSFAIHPLPRTPPEKNPPPLRHPHGYSRPLLPIRRLFMAIQGSDCRKRWCELVRICWE